MANETNNDHFPDCEIGEVLRACGALTVNAATLRLPGGITRRAALERYPSYRAPEAQAAFTADMELRLRFSEMQLIPQIYDFGFDEAQGAWALWARPGKTLREMIGDNPAPVPAVRQVLGQTLRVLAVFQEQTPPFVYVAINPDNIVRLNGGEWVLDGVTVGGPTNPWRHPSAHAEATTAPEVLDVDLGDISPATDLYALGMSVYQFALGKKLFAQQVPAVFQSPAPDKSASDLWLAWQASPQLVLPPLEKLLPGFPQDVSEIVERMLRKKPEERAVAAKDLLDKLNLPIADKVAIDGDHDEHGAGGGLGKLLGTTGGGAVMKWLGVAIVALFLLALLALAFNDPAHENVKLEVEQEHYDTTQPSITIRGKSKNVPYNCILAVAVKNGFVVGRAYTNPDTNDGTFAVDVPLDALGEFLGGVGVINRDGEVYAQHNFTVTRRPPAEVTLLLRTYPTAPNAEVTVTATPAPPSGNAKEPAKPAPAPVRRSAKTDAKGVLRVTIPYGNFTVAVSHPGFLGFQRTFTPGIDAVQTVVLDLTSVSPMVESHNLASRESKAQEALKNDLARLRAAKANGTITAEEEKKLAALEKS
ncbi:MAG: hypothetical protein J6333_01245, partial [Planctomycetes bacterium]|nr:hypothetical protein [Planctomycetota bacterium]